jgi:hypothetical protein
MGSVVFRFRLRDGANVEGLGALYSPFRKPVGLI